MPQFESLPCKTRLRCAESRTDPIGDLFAVHGSVLEPVGDLGEIVGYHAIEIGVGTPHCGASGAGRRRFPAPPNDVRGSPSVGRRHRHELI